MALTNPQIIKIYILLVINSETWYTDLCDNEAKNKASNRCTLLTFLLKQKDKNPHHKNTGAKIILITAKNITIINVKTVVYTISLIINFQNNPLRLLDKEEFWN